MDLQLLTNVRVFRKKFEVPNWQDDDHLFALVGKGAFSVESSEDASTVRQGEGFLFRGGEAYHREILEPATLYLFRFRSPEPPFPTDHVRFADGERVAATVRLLDRLESSLSGDELAARAHLLQDLVLQHRLENRLSLSDGNNWDPRIRKAAGILTAGYNRKIDLQAVAVQCGLSYAQFFRLFQRDTGTAPARYLAGLRLQKARSLLAESSLPVGKIAFACGFENEYYFSNFFKKHTGLSPTAFRQEMA